MGKVEDHLGSLEAAFPGDSLVEVHPGSHEEACLDEGLRDTLKDAYQVEVHLSTLVEDLLDILAVAFLAGTAEDTYLLPSNTYLDHALVDIRHDAPRLPPPLPRPLQQPPRPSPPRPVPPLHRSYPWL